jgi:capsular polysaccharide transport system permease protein
VSDERVGSAGNNGRRSPLAVTLDVWRALFLREAVSRITASRFAWAWLVLEPMAYVAFMMFLYSAIRVKVIPGADATLWLAMGFVPFLTARNIFMRGMEAINANQMLFIYRLVLPVDTVLVRALLEAFLGLIVLALVLALAALLGMQVVPADVAKVMLGYGGLCLVGLGLGLMLSVGAELVTEVRRIFRMAMRPLTLLSCVMFPPTIVPAEHRYWLFLNPFASGLEMIRSGFFPYYHAAPETSAGYLYAFALVVVFLGLALQFRYTVRLRAQ